MTRRALRLLAAGTLSISAAAFAQTPPAAPDSVYAPPELPRADQGVNEGALHLDGGLSYFTDYVYRGVEVFEVPAHEDSLNLQIDGKLSFDLGKLPHPYASVFVNVADADPISDFQEIRPTVGFDWPIKPLVFSAGYTAYLYPERNERQTNEVFAEVAFDDKVLYHGEPIPTPYLLAAYDFDKYDGVYIEGGIRYRYSFEDIGLSLTASANVAYVAGYRAYIHQDQPDQELGFFTADGVDRDHVSGFQHYQIGLMGDYSLNKLFHVSNRYGEFSIRGYVYYTDGMSDDLAATTQIWGGAGINLSY